MTEGLIYTSLLASVVIGWSGARVVWFWMSRREYRGRHRGVPRAEAARTGGRARHVVSDVPSHPGQGKVIR